MSPNELGESTLHPFSAQLQGEKPPNALELQLCRWKAQHVPPLRLHSSAAAWPVCSVPAATEAQPAAGVRGGMTVT